ncbi:MAG: hypothetical protein ACJA2N_001613 [Salibacteraceae bacterium]
MVFEGEKRDFHNLLKLEGNYFLITSYLDKKKRNVVLYSHKLNRETLNFEVSIEITNHSFEEFKRTESPIFKFKQTNSGKHLVVVTSLPSAKENTYHFELMVLNSEMKVVWSKSNLEIYTRYPNLAPHDAKISADGRVFFLAKIFYPYKRSKGLNYRFEMYVFSPGLDKPKIFPIKFDKGLISDLKFEFYDSLFF